MVGYHRPYSLIFNLVLMHTNSFSFSLLWFVFYILSLLGLSMQYSYAYSCSLKPSPARGQPIALVIANSQYKDRRLRQAINDAKAMKNVLSKLGFKVIFKTELDNSAMDRATIDFRNCLRISQDVGLFYFSGYGMQLNNRNYLLPINVSIRDRYNIKYDTFPVNKILARLKSIQNILNIIILDASRNHHYRNFDKHRGLASISAPTGFFIAYPTFINEVLRYDYSYNSLYVTELTKILKTAGQKHKRIDDVFMEVANSVKNSNNSQEPYYIFSLKEMYCFGGCIKEPPDPEPLWNLKVNSNQNGAKVFIDFRRRGYTPLTVNLPPRCYTVWVEKSGYTLLDRSKWVCLKKGKKKVIHFKFK